MRHLRVVLCTDGELLLPAQERKQKREALPAVPSAARRPLQQFLLDVGAARYTDACMGVEFPIVSSPVSMDDPKRGGRASVTPQGVRPLPLEEERQRCKGSCATEEDATLDLQAELAPAVNAAAPAGGLRGIGDGSQGTLETGSSPSLHIADMHTASVPRLGNTAMVRGESAQEGGSSCAAAADLAAASLTATCTSQLPTPQVSLATAALTSSESAPSLGGVHFGGCEPEDRQRPPRPKNLLSSMSFSAFPTAPVARDAVPSALSVSNHKQAQQQVERRRAQVQMQEHLTPRARAVAHLQQPSQHRVCPAPAPELHRARFFTLAAIQKCFRGCFVLKSVGCAGRAADATELCESVREEATSRQGNSSGGDDAGHAALPCLPRAFRGCSERAGAHAVVRRIGHAWQTCESGAFRFITLLGARWKCAHWLLKRALQATSN